MTTPAVLPPGFDENPYAQGETRLLAERLPRLVERPRDSQNDAEAFADYGDALWRLTRQAVSYWTPHRLEDEALRRAGDSPGTSVVAEEADRLTFALLSWMVPLHEWESSMIEINSSRWPMPFRRSLLLRDRIQATLDVLEARARVVEARALDLRLRFDADKLRAQLANREVASELSAAIIAAASNPENQARLREVSDKLAALETKISSVHVDGAFVADYVTEEIARKLTRTSSGSAIEFVQKTVAGEGVKKILAKVIELVSSS